MGSSGNNVVGYEMSMEEVLKLLISLTLIYSKLDKLPGLIEIKYIVILITIETLDVAIRIDGYKQDSNNIIKVWL